MIVQCLAVRLTISGWLAFRPGTGNLAELGIARKLFDNFRELLLNYPQVVRQLVNSDDHTPN